MSPRIVRLLSGRDRRHYVRELRLAEQAHRELPARVEEAYRAAHRLACEEWSVRQFIGGPAEPSPRGAGEAMQSGGVGPPPPPLKTTRRPQHCVGNITVSGDCRVSENSETSNTLS